MVLNCLGPAITLYVTAHSGRASSTKGSLSMRFCMVTTFYPPYHFGGDALYVQQLARELAARGHQVEVVHCVDAYQLLTRKAPIEDDAEVPNLTVHRLKSGTGLLSPLATQQTGRPVFKSRRLREILRQKFDVIHYHNISLIGGPAVLKYGEARKLYTLHEYWLLCPTHMLFKFDREVCSSRQCLACTLAHGRPPQLWRYSGLLERAVSNVDMFIAPSTFTKNKHDRLLGRQRVERLPYFTSRWDASARETDSRSLPPPYFLFVGRLEKIKGLQTLIEPFRACPDAQLWIVGTGDYESTLREQAQDCPNLRFLGFQTGESLRRLYQDAIAVIVPSIWEEVFGIIILEAFAQRTPVIVRKRGGMPEVVDTSKGGIVYETDSELMTAVAKLVREPALRRTLGQQGYEALKQHWTADVHIRKYLELIDSLSGPAADAANQTPTAKLTSA